MSKITIIDGNSNDKDNLRAFMVKGEKGDKGDTGDPTKVSQLENDVGYITADEANLQNYYNKGEIDDIVDELNDTIDEKADTTDIETQITTINNTLSTKLNKTEAQNTYATKTELNSGISGEATARTNGDSNLQSQISSLANGSPLVASSTAGMTDTTKVYVNTTDGKWYYYNGSNWTVGGTYQASVNSDDVNALLNRVSSIYDYEHATILNANNSQDTITSSSSNKTLFVPVVAGKKYLVGRTITDNNYCQIAFTDNNEVGANIIGDKITININGQKRIQENPLEVTAPAGSSYMSIWFYNTSDTYSATEIGKSIYIFKVDYLNQLIENARGVFGTNSVRVNQVNYETALSDFNNAKKSKAYVFYYATNYYDVPLNSPVTNIIDGLLLSFSPNDFKTTIQLFIQKNKMYYRSCNDNELWNDWILLLDSDNIPKTFYVGATRTYTTLKEGIAEAVKYKNSIVYVDAGTYDIIQEYGGQSYVDANYTGSTMGNGITLKNNVHVIFSTNSKVVCNFTGTNANFMNNFSPFNVGAGGFTLENLNIECSKCRYCVHDDLYSQEATYTKTHYLNCRMYLDNNQNTVRENYDCIGGGMPINGAVIIDGCIFETTANLSQNNMKGGLNYHQNGNENAQSKILIKNSICLGLKDNFSFGNLGSSTKVSTVIVTNTKSKLAPSLSINSSYPTNVELIEYNNVIS